MKIASFQDPQFLDASAAGGLNPAFATVSGSVASVGSGAWAAPGLLAPDAMTLAFSGMVATVGLPPPWGLVASGGVVVRAHGTQTGRDTQTYTVDFTPLAPTGTITAYLTATVAQIQQSPFPIPGPPPGHPAYDPNFVPTVGYAQQVYTVALAAVSGVPDNVNTFELMRTTLASGQTTVTEWSSAGQVRATNLRAQAGLVLASGGTLAPWQLQSVLMPAVSGLTHTLPPASRATGLLARFVNPTSGPWTLAVSDFDILPGVGPETVENVTIPASGSLSLWANGPGTASPPWTDGNDGMWSVLGLASPAVTGITNGVASVYGRLSCGLTVQVCAALLPVQATTVLDFPTPFENMALAVVGSLGYYIPSMTDAIGVGCQPISLSQFNATLATALTSGSAGCWFIAVGW